MSFADSRLSGHLRSHTEERPFICEWPNCNKGFARQHDCKRHYALHNAKPNQHVCEGCNKTFSRTDALNRHRALFWRFSASHYTYSLQTPLSSSLRRRIRMPQKCCFWLVAQSGPVQREYGRLSFRTSSSRRCSPGQCAEWPIPHLPGRAGRHPSFPRPIRPPPAPTPNLARAQLTTPSCGWRVPRRPPKRPTVLGCSCCNRIH